MGTTVKNMIVYRGSFITQILLFSYHPLSEPTINRENSIWSLTTLSSQTKYGMTVKDHSTAENRIEFACETMNQSIVSLGFESEVLKGGKVTR